MVYFHNFSFANAECRSCSSSFAIHHPLTSLRFLLSLVGNVMALGTGSTTSPLGTPSSVVQIHAVLGALILCGAGYVVVQSLRERQRFPVLVILFAILFDLVITEGRVGLGPLAALASYYSMPNLILFLGIIAYGWRHPPRSSVRILAVVFFAAQVSLATGFGIHTGPSSTPRVCECRPRVVVNYRHAPECDVIDWAVHGLDTSLVPTVFKAWRLIAIRDSLSLYQTNVREYRLDGLPPCTSPG